MVKGTLGKFGSNIERFQNYEGFEEIPGPGTYDQTKKDMKF